MEKEMIVDMLESPEKYIFGHDMDKEKKSRYDEFLISKKHFIGNDLVLFPIEYMLNYVTDVVKMIVDAALVDSFAIGAHTSYEGAEVFNYLSANAIGNLAYVCVNCKDENIKELARQKLIEIFIWKVKVYQSFIDTINAIN